MLASYLVLFCLVSFATVDSAHADSKTITSEASYIMGDGESPSFAESMALQKAKQIALEEAGTYVESYTKTRNQDLTKDEIQTLAGGVLQVEIIEKIRTLVQDGLRVHLKIRATVTTDKMEELARRIRGKNLAGEYRDLQAKYDSLEREVTRLKQTLAKSPSSLERETALNRIREHEGSFATLQRKEAALFMNVVHGEALASEAKNVLNLPDTVMQSILMSGMAVTIGELRPELVHGRREQIRLNFDVTLSPNEKLFSTLREIARQKLASIEPVSLYSSGSFVTAKDGNGSWVLKRRKPLINATLIQFPNTTETYEGLWHLNNELRDVILIVEFFGETELLGVCYSYYGSSHIWPNIVPTDQDQEIGLDLREAIKNELLSASQYFSSEAEYQEFKRLDHLVESWWSAALTGHFHEFEKWLAAREKYFHEHIASKTEEETVHHSGRDDISPINTIEELEHREASGQLSPATIALLNKMRSKLPPRPKEPAWKDFSKEIQQAKQNRDAMASRAWDNLLMDHPPLYRFKAVDLKSRNESAPFLYLLVMNEPSTSAQEFVIDEVILGQVKKTIARLTRESRPKRDYAKARQHPLAYAHDFGCAQMKLPK